METRKYNELNLKVVAPAIDSTIAPRGDRLQQIYIDNMTGIERFEKNLGEINTPIYKKISSLRNGRSILNMYSF